MIEKGAGNPVKLILVNFAYHGNSVGATGVGGVLVIVG